MNIKNIIFDLDNTLIEDRDEDIIHYKEALSSLNYNEDEYISLYSAIDKYELSKTEKDNFYSQSELIDFLNKHLNKNYSVSLIDELNKVIVKYWSSRPLITENLLADLSSKYNLYVYTNWFKAAQEKRLQTIGFSKYFKEVFTPEYYGAKPFKKSYENVLSKINCTASDCVMIGDSLRSDIYGSLNSGLNAILFDRTCKDSSKDFTYNNKTYNVINDFEELRKIFL